MTTDFATRGAHTALVTPFSSDGSLDVAGWKKLVAFQAKQGIDGIVPGGTTGESPTLTWDDHGVMIEEASSVAGSLSILAGTGSNNTEEAIEATGEARKRGASAVLLVDCYYNGPSSLELRVDYYERILDAVPDIAIVPYIIPGRTGCALSAEDLAILHGRDPKRVVAVKEATGDFERMRRDRALAGESLAIFSGDDDLTVPMMRDASIRACGVISVVSNLVPRAMADLVRAVEAGNEAEADRLSKAIAPLTSIITLFADSERVLPNGTRVTVTDKFRNPVATKAVMAGLGMVGPYVRPPLGKMTAPAVARCREAAQAVWTANPELLSPIEDAFGVSIAARLADDDAWSVLVR